MWLNRSSWLYKCFNGPWTLSCIFFWFSIQYQPSWCLVVMIAILLHWSRMYHVTQPPKVGQLMLLCDWRVWSRDPFDLMPPLCKCAEISKHWQNDTVLWFPDRILIAIGTCVPIIMVDKSLLVILRHFAASLIGYQPSLKEILCGLLNILHSLVEVNMLLNLPDKKCVWQKSLNWNCDCLTPTV